MQECQVGKVDPSDVCISNCEVECRFALGLYVDQSIRICSGQSDAAHHLDGEWGWVADCDSRVYIESILAGGPCEVKVGDIKGAVAVDEL